MKRLLFLILSALLSLSAMAQKLTVESFELTTSLDGKKYARLDANDDGCALIKVALARPGAVFEGNVVGDVEYKVGEYWVYSYTGSTKTLTVKTDVTQPLRVYFPDYGIDRLQPYCTYSLVLTLPPLGVPSVQDDGLAYFVLKFSPADASVMIDGTKQPEYTDAGVAQILLPPGRHTYQVTRQGYRPKNEAFTMGSSRTEHSVQLDLQSSTLTVRNATADADVYVNDTRRGKGTWTGSLPPSTYRVEARKAGHVTQRQTVTLQADSSLVVTFPALAAITGLLDVNYKPVDSEVWLDGKKLGVSPDKFRDVPVGRHRVEIRKAGYQTFAQAIAISESQPTVLKGELQREVASTSSGNASSSSAYVPTTSVGQPSHPASTSYHRPVETTFYYGLDFQAGSLMGIDGLLGLNVSHFNVQLDAVFGLKKSEKIGWRNQSDNKPTNDAFSYRTFNYGVKLGYFIGDDYEDGFSVTPQVGIGVANVTSADSSRGSSTKFESGECNGYAVPASVGARLTYSFEDFGFGISLCPEYCFAISESDTYSKLANVSSAVKGFGSGFNIRLGFYFF